MKINGTHTRTIWVDDDGWTIGIIDQTKLPHVFETAELKTVVDAARAIKNMLVRGAPLIGAAAAYGICLALREDASNENLEAASELLICTRPTAVNLRWAVDEMTFAVRNLPHEKRVIAAYARAAEICDEDVEMCRMIGVHGLKLIRKIARRKKGKPVNILTHCNAGWLATVDWGTATSPIYQAHGAGIPLHVWVDETRPRNQGAALTAFELGHADVPHTIIADNAGGHLMQRGDIDLCITGTDRITANGDVINKIGTYLKALAAADNEVPFYVALPHTTIDWELQDGFEVPIEERGSKEVTQMSGRTSEGKVITIDIAAPGSPAANPAFDVSPARLITGLITERGVCDASLDGLLGLYPEMIDDDPDDA